MKLLTLEIQITTTIALWFIVASSLRNSHSKSLLIQLTLLYQANTFKCYVWNCNDSKKCSIPGIVFPSNKRKQTIFIIPNLWKNLLNRIFSLTFPNKNRARYAKFQIVTKKLRNPNRAFHWRWIETILQWLSLWHISTHRIREKMHKFHLGISDSEVILHKRQFSVVPCWHNKKTTKPPLNGHIYLFNYPLTLAGILNLIFAGSLCVFWSLRKRNLKGARNNIVNYFMGLASCPCK